MTSGRSMSFWPRTVGSFCRHFWTFSQNYFKNPVNFPLFCFVFVTWKVALTIFHQVALTVIGYCEKLLLLFLTFFDNFRLIFAHLAQLCLVSDKEHGPSAIYHLVFDDDDRDTRGIQKRFLHAYTSSWLIFWLLYLLLSICLFVHLSLCWDT